jgi:spore maturation protein CgeB
MNDDPFGPDADKHWLKHYKKTIPLFDIIFSFREVNIPEYKKSGANHTEVMLPYYVRGMHYPRTLLESEELDYACDALFIGHGENDNRLSAFDEILKAGLNLRLGGSNFEKYARGHLHERILPSRYYFADEYAKAVKAANCSLCFFSKRNRDVLTTRVFEIPACGGVLVAERNDVVASLFKEGEEAFFFETNDELISIIRNLKENPSVRHRVAENGRIRVLKGRHEVADRARQIIESIERIKS